MNNFCKKHLFARNLQGSRAFLVLSALLLSSTFVAAQLPHEVLLLVNRESQASKKVANFYIEMRGIPRQNVVYVDVPMGVYIGSASITPGQFTDLIWEPANKIAKERGIDQQIRAWIYSVDFPIRVLNDKSDRKQMSLLGLTFVRNKIPGTSLIEDGKYFSRLFAGPNKRIKQSRVSMSLDLQKRGVGPEAKVPEGSEWLKEGLGDKMPLPAMMLGYTGTKGNDVDTVLKTMVRGKQSDYRGARGNIYFVMNDDVRSKCREWQFYPAVNELKNRGITATVSTNFPAGQKNVMGIMMGAETVDPSSVGSFWPGAVAEHLTSWSAEFQKPQTKMTEWIRAGATGSAGTVVEPYSNHDKFPSARFFAHYAAGCTMLESFYQSIACPLQILLLGDPLAKPYAVPYSVNILGADSIENDFTYIAMPKIQARNVQFHYSFLLDGKEIQGLSENNSVHVRLMNLADGWHELRAVARIKNMAELSASFDKEIMVNKTGRSVEIDPNIGRLGKHEHGVKVKIGGQQVPEKLRLVSGSLILDEQVYDPEVELVLDEQMLGEGPNRIRAVAIYSDGMEVSSRPLSLGITFKLGQ